jgi:streptomycin 6-kinase
MIKLGLVLAAGYTGFKAAYHSEDGRHYGETGERAIRATLSLLIASLAGGITYAALLSH